MTSVTSSPEEHSGGDRQLPRGGSLRGTLTRWAAVVLTALLGGYLGWRLAPGASATIGPLTVHLNLGLGLHGGTTLDLPPFGQVSFASHQGPISAQASVVSVDEKAAAAVMRSSDSLNAVTAAAPGQIRAALIRAALWCVLCASIGSAVVCRAVTRRHRHVMQAVATVMIPVVVSALVAGASFDAAASRQPQFTGLLSRAPYLAGQGRDMLTRLESYRSGVADMVSAVSTVYAKSEDLPVLPKDQRVVTVLHISDVHLNPQAYDLTGRLISQFGVDAVVDTGDVTSWGTAAESRTLNRIGRLGVPYVFVRGNHDSPTTAAAVAREKGAVVLEGTAASVAGLRFAGIGDASFTPDAAGEAGKLSSKEVAGGTATKLAGIITTRGRARQPVDVALIHNAAHPEALYGKVPLVLSGHTHTRTTTVDPATQTRVMVEGSTGGAGLTSGAVENLERSRPAPLEATLLYFAPPTATARARLLAWDDVTVGGLGLSSVTVARTMAQQPAPKPSPSVSGTASPR